MNACNNRWLILCCLSMALLLHTACEIEKLDPRTLCPVNGSEQQTILLIDTTDPLTPVAQEKLKQLLKEFRDSDKQHYLQTGHKLIVYRVTPNITDNRKPLLRVCNPGNPEDRTWKDDLTSGKYGALQKWRHFEHSILQALPKINEQVTKEQSPLLETIALVTARHVPSPSVKTQLKPTRLILFSDMLQHSNLLSHYKSLPDMETFQTMTGYASMASDLRDVGVWLFYVRRTGLENQQTSKHYYWWTQVMEELFGGRVMKQKPL